MAFAPFTNYIDAHYRVIPPPPSVVHTFIPNIGTIAKSLLAGPMPVQIEQTGLCYTSALSDLHTNEGNCTITGSLTTLTIGTWAGMYKAFVDPTPEMTSTGGDVIAYRIIWQQVGTGSVS